MRNAMISKAGIVGLLLSLLVIAGTAFALQSQNTPAYTIQIQTRNDSSTAFKRPELPDLSSYTIAAIRARMPDKNAPAAAIQISEMKNHRGFLPTHSLHKDYAKMQGAENAKVILLQNGAIDMDGLYKRIGNDVFLEKTKNGYLLKLPLYVDSGASLIINGTSQSLYMMQSNGVFVASRGDVYALDTNIIGWDDEKNAAAIFKDKKLFRPFIVFWDGSKSYIANSRLAHLGYSAAKAYGLTYSTNGAYIKNNPSSAWPSGWLLNSEIEDLYYGMYSHEAEDIAMIGNVFKSNIVYGIDPHDRSKNLIIAKNETTGTKIKHGIIVSRAVNNSWIFENTSHGNAGAGIMIERNSRNNVVANNTLYGNLDGLSFYESSDNISWGNEIYGNEKNGIRIRNSQNVILRDERVADNGRYGIEAYSADLSGHERDLSVDPYEQITTFDLASSSFDQNSGGQIRFKNIDRARLSGLQSLRVASGFMSGDLKSESMKLYDLLQQPQSVLYIQNAQTNIGAAHTQ